MTEEKSGARSNPVLELQGVRKSFGDTEIIRGVDLTLLEGERHALIGPNGAGKSTVFHLISGLLAPDEGTIALMGKPIHGLAAPAINRMGLARSFQITNVFPGMSVFENLRLGVMRHHGLQYRFWSRISTANSVNEETERMLEKVRLEDSRDTLAGVLSYSGQRSLEIGMALTSDPRVLLLDEPMAGMSREETAYTIGLIRELTEGRSLLLVEHDMEVVFSLSDRVSVLVYGQVIATGTPEEIQNSPVVREAYLGTEAPA